VHDVPTVEPKNRIQTLFTNAELTPLEQEHLEAGMDHKSGERYRIVINCMSQQVDKRVSSKITIGY